MIFKHDIKDEKITLNEPLNEDQKTTINSLSGVQEFPMRIKCYYGVARIIICY